MPNSDIILFAEDLNEPVYKIDRMFTQLLNLKELRKNIKGIALGEFRDIDNAAMLDEVIMEIALSLDVPVVRGFKITHDKVKDTLPYGVEVLFDSEQGILKILDDYVV